MYNIIYYTTENDNCPVKSFLYELSKDKSNLRILTKIELYIKMLAEYGPSINIKYKRVACKLVDSKNGIYELRPDNVRVFYFYNDNNQRYVLLHGFIKKKNRAEAEIQKAIKEKKDYVRRFNNECK